MESDTEIRALLAEFDRRWPLPDKVVRQAFQELRFFRHKIALVLGVGFDAALPQILQRAVEISDEGQT